ncbi:hypothetical protein PFISCL1PPCAC_13508 [Pristionchus fissidentatus]|uniref:Uncharacterized protein n=1 Tax=Pristionchus fissidentatus TaxID=1538716 RepID=A0AAV5VRZ3_9BILA|nr:hypothetical protein PFISCL1PPCAC_13508 [Pristionchus fissidentatus]
MTTTATTTTMGTTITITMIIMITIIIIIIMTMTITTIITIITTTGRTTAAEVVAGAMEADGGVDGTGSSTSAVGTMTTRGGSGVRTATGPGGPRCCRGFLENEQSRTRGRRWLCQHLFAHSNKYILPPRMY